jgi:hypothetical protein
MIKQLVGWLKIKIKHDTIYQSVLASNKYFTSSETETEIYNPGMILFGHWRGSTQPSSTKNY